MLKQTLQTRRVSTVIAWMVGAAGLMAGLGWASPASAEDPKIGYVDLHEALNSVEEGKKAKKQLKQNYQKKQKKLNSKQKEVKKLKKELKNKGMGLSDEAKMKKQKKLRRKLMELQRLYMKMQKELKTDEAEATKEIFKKMRKIVEKIAEEKNYDLVLEKRKASVLHANDGMDLTDELIKRYEKKH